MKTIHFEHLLGREVLDPDGKRIGRILEVSSKRDGKECGVHEYMLGTAALLTRLGISAQRLVGLKIRRKPLCIPWDQLDLRDPRKPRLKCSLAELKGRQE
jgi:sporulation protein YlmC with PRC-barrel domain